MYYLYPMMVCFIPIFLGATSWHGQRSFPEENRPRAIFRSPELRRRRMLGPELSGTLSQEEWVQARLPFGPVRRGSARAPVILTQHAVRWVMSSSYVRALNHELVWEYKWIYIYIYIYIYITPINDGWLRVSLGFICYIGDYHFSWTGNPS